MNLSNNFTLEQFIFSEAASRRNLDNTPSPEQVQNLTELAMALDRVQLILGYPLHISSAYRSPKVNSAIGGSITSAHMEGYAADFTCEAFGTPLEVCKAIAASDIAFDQIIWEYKSWCHFSSDPRFRKETLTKVAGEPYMNGFVEV